MSEQEMNRIKKIFSDFGVSPEYFEPEPVITSADAAKTRGFELKQGIKAIVFANGKGDGIFIIGYSALALLFTVLKRYKLLWIPAILSIAQLTYALITFTQKMSEASGLISISMEWGWLVLFAGAVLLVLAAARKAPETTNSSSETA